VSGGMGPGSSLLAIQEVVKRIRLLRLRPTQAPQQPRPDLRHGLSRAAGCQGRPPGEPRHRVPQKLPHLAAYHPA